MSQKNSDIPVALTFDDVLLLPAASKVLPNEVDVRTKLTRSISMNIPLMSAAMDTVTEANTAISMAREGGIGIIHKNMSIERQAREVDKVKKSESGMIVDPVTMHPEQKISEVLEVMEQYRISGVPIVKDGRRLVGIITNRDLRFETNLDQKVAEVMTKENLVTASEGITLEESKILLHKNRIEKLLVVNDKGELLGLITIKDIMKIKQYPSACKDSLGRLRVGAAVGVGPDRDARVEALVNAGVDVIAVDSAHGHAQAVVDSVPAIKRQFPEIELIAGNVATAEGAKTLAEAGAD
ncbi:MAG: IMP dehydrogenase, partial [Syntrophobacteria bacterium]